MAVYGQVPGSKASHLCSMLHGLRDETCNDSIKDLCSLARSVCIGQSIARK